jgi:hypothetical protein
MNLTPVRTKHLTGKRKTRERESYRSSFYMGGKKVRFGRFGREGGKIHAHI